MPNRGTSQSWPGCRRLWMWLLIALLAATSQAQSDSPGGSECESLRAEVGDLRRIPLDTSVLKLIENDVQTVVNCMPAHGVVNLFVSDLPLEDAIRVRKPITIHGNGASVPCPNDEHKGAFNIRSNDVTISDMVFEGCDLNSTVGLIDVKSSKNVTLMDVKFVGNNNVAGTGCISVAESAIKLVKVEARNNSGILGGVLFAEMDSKITIMDSDFSDNEASERGGAAYFHNSNASITATNFGGNKALNMGGAVFAEGALDSYLMLENVTFSDGEANIGGGVALVGPKLKADINTTIFARNSATFAGGLMSDNGTTLSILDSRFDENFALLGGAILAQAFSPDITNLEVRGTTFQSNSAKGEMVPGVARFGGAMTLLGAGVSGTIFHATFSDNKAGDSGGAILASQIRSLEISTSAFSRNRAIEGIEIQSDDGQQESGQNEITVSMADGGALHISNVPEISIKKSNFTNNRAIAGGAIGINGFEESDTRIVECIFEGNSGTGDPRVAAGGGLHLAGNGLNVSIKSSNFTKNKSVAVGGAIHGLTISRIEISDSYFIENEAASGDGKSIMDGAIGPMKPEGGAILLGEVAESGIFNSTFAQNEAVRGGGVSVQIIDLEEAVLRIEDSTFRDNQARDQGGAVVVGGRGLAVLIDGSKFENNTSTQGGGIFSLISQLNINNTRFSGNLAGSGGAVELMAANASIAESIFRQNVADGSGGAINGGFSEINELQVNALDDFFLRIESSVFSENEASATGGAIVMLTNDVNLKCSLRGSKFQRNKAMEGGAVDTLRGTTMNVSRCSFTNNTGIEGGGGMSLMLSTVLIEGTSFEGNVAHHGGALGLTFANATLVQSNFTGNIAQRTDEENFGNNKGGAIYSIHLRPHQNLLVEGNSSSSPEGDVLPATERKKIEREFAAGQEEKQKEAAFLKLRDVEFKHNYAASSGGGALFLGGVDLQMEGGLCRNNSSPDNGGAVYLLRFSGSFPNATIKSWSFVANRAVLGGAIFAHNRNLYLSDCDFQDNVARNGGGALHCEDSGLNLVEGQKNSVIAVHSSDFGGNMAGVSQREKEYSELTSVNGRGGAVLMAGLGLVSEFRNCTFSKNAAGSGGSVHMQDVKNLTLIDSGFWMGSALTGGALTVISAGDSFTVNNVSFVENAARWGGALSLSLSTGTRFDGLFEGPVSLTQALFVENLATRGGGAVDLKERTLECNSCYFESNSAGFDGGAFRAVSAFNVTLMNSTVANCTAGQSGGGISLEDGLFVGEHVSILNNTAVKNGGGLAVQFATFAGNQLVPWRCTSCIIQGNMATKGGGMHVSTYESIPQDCQDLEATPLVKNQHQRLELLADCQRGPNNSDSLGLRVMLDSTTIEENIAEDSGSQIFLSNFQNSICCDSQCWTSTSDVDGALQKCAFSETPLMNGKKSIPLGTLFEAVLISPSRVTGHASDKELPAVKVTAIDSFGQISVDKVNLRVEVTTAGGELFGNPVTKEGVLMKGEINVTGIFMRAFPGSYDLFFELASEDGDRLRNASMVVDIRDCEIGEIPQEGGLRCDRCPDDFFSFDVTDENCTPCPVDKAKCSGGTLVPLDGFWHSSPRTAQLHTCLIPEACTYPNRTTILFESSSNFSGDYPQCAKGYKDVFCGSCNTSHGKSRFRCTECQGGVYAVVGIGIVMFALALLSLISVRSAAKHSHQVLGTQPNAANQNQGPSSLHGGSTIPQGDSLHQTALQRRKQGSDIFKILVNFFQVTASAAAINVGWSESMMALFTTWDMVFGVAESNSYFSFDCAFTSRKNGLPSSIQTSIFLGFVPIMVWATLTILYAGHALKNKKTFQNFRLWSCVALLAVIQASYISVTRTFVRIFYCVDASPLTGLFWVQDTSVVCYKGSHAFLAGFIGAPGLLLIAIGFPGWLLFKLTRSTESLESEEVIRCYGFLYQAYKKKVAAWEVVILLRKAFLAAIVVFGRTLGEGIQGNLALVIMMASIILQLLFQPFLESKLNIMELASLVISMLAFIIGNLMGQPKMTVQGRVAMSVIFIVVVGIYVAYMLKQIFDAAFLDLREWLENKNPGILLPKNNLGLLIAAVKILATKAKPFLKEMKGRFGKKVARNLSCELLNISS